MAGASVAGPSAVDSARADAGVGEARPADAGRLLPKSSPDGGPPLSLEAEDQAVVRDLELLEHLSEAELLEVLLPVRDQ
ncbi:MAG: hypothetical protein ACLPJH_05090 [Myxococcaceae bacterium]